MKTLQLSIFFSVKPESIEESNDTAKQENDKQASSAENGDENNQGKDQHENSLHDGGSFCLSCLIKSSKLLS